MSPKRFSIMFAMSRYSDPFLQASPCVSMTCLRNYSSVPVKPPQTIRIPISLSINTVVVLYLEPNPENVQIDSIDSTRASPETHASPE